jgi:hypothetical protein
LRAGTLEGQMVAGELRMRFYYVSARLGKLPVNAAVRDGQEMEAALYGGPRRHRPKPSIENPQNQTQVLRLATILECSLPNTGPRFCFTGGHETSTGHTQEQDSAKHIPHYEHTAL